MLVSKYLTNEMYYPLRLRSTKVNRSEWVRSTSHSLPSPISKDNQFTYKP